MDQALQVTVLYFLRGFSQVVFSDSILGGLLILTGLFVANPWLGFLAVVGCFTGTATGVICALNQADVAKGLSGYNGALVGCAFAVFLEYEVWAWQSIVATACGSVAQALLTLAMSNMYGCPVWSYPFNLVLLITCLHAEPLRGVSSENLHIEDLTWPERAAAISTGISQIFVVNNWITGVLIAVGLAVYSLRLSASVVLGSLVGMLVAIAIGVDAAEIRDGLWGYDAALTAAAVYTFWELTWQMMVFMVVAAAMTAVVHAGLADSLAEFGAPSGSLSFCITATMCFLMIDRVRGLRHRGFVRFADDKTYLSKDAIDRTPVPSSDASPHSAGMPTPEVGNGQPQANEVDAAV